MMRPVDEVVDVRPLPEGGVEVWSVANKRPLLRLDALAALTLADELTKLARCRASAAALIAERTPCGDCDGDGVIGDERCCVCYGRGRIYFAYGEAYRALVALEKRGLVERCQVVDRWGDRTTAVSWIAASSDDAEDPLERAFRAPSAEGHRP
jgi:hypothetical protein